MGYKWNERTLAAIQTLSSKLIPNSTGDKRRDYVVRLENYSRRLLVDVVPELVLGPAKDDEATADDPMLVPSQRIPGGALVSLGAVLDAASIATVNAGGDPAPPFAPYAGLAEKEGFTGVTSSTGPNGIVFTVFLAGKVVATQTGDGTTDTSALGEQYGIVWN